MSPDRDLARPRARRPLLRTAAVAAALTAAALGTVALPSAASAAPAAPAAPATTVVGELVHVWAEGQAATADAEHAHDTGTRLSWVETGAGSVRVPAEQVAGVDGGATVELTLGAPVEDEASEDGYEPARTVLAGDVVQQATLPTEPAVSPRTGLTNEVTVVLVAPAGTTPDGTLLTDVVATVDGPVANFWAEQTGGAIRLGVTGAENWVSTSAGCATPEAMWDEAAAAVGFVPGPGKHLMLRLSSQSATQPACAYGMAQVGSGPASGGRLYVRDTLTPVIAHELGHNFGLGHSSSAQCDAAVEGGSCRTAGYGDLYDVMGASWARMGALNAVQASALGVLPAGTEQVVTVQDAPRTVSLAPLAGAGEVRAVRLVDAEGVAYWLELRSATGQDEWLGTQDNVHRLDAGVLLHRAGQFPDTSLLLDGTPSPADRWDADRQSALPLGVAVPVSGGDFTVTVQRVDGGGAVVQVIPSSVPVSASAPSTGPDRPAGALLSGRPAAAATPEPAQSAPAAPVPAAAPAAPTAPAGMPPVATVVAQQAVRAPGNGPGVLMPVAASALGGTALLALGATLRITRRAALRRR